MEFPPRDKRVHQKWKHRLNYEHSSQKKVPPQTLRSRSLTVILRVAAILVTVLIVKTVDAGLCLFRLQLQVFNIRDVIR